MEAADGLPCADDAAVAASGEGDDSPESDTAAGMVVTEKPQETTPAATIADAAAEVAIPKLHTFQEIPHLAPTGGGASEPTPSCGGGVQTPP